MTEGAPATDTPPLLRLRKWLKYSVAALGAYLLCWSITWAFAPAAMNRWWATHHSPMGRDLGGNAEPVEFRTGVPFKKGEKWFDYGPDFTPAGKWWCCVGQPSCPAPFVVASEVAWMNGPLSGYAGEVWFVWTPLGMIRVYERHVWAA
jgi:hypothetical protein